MALLEKDLLALTAAFSDPDVKWPYKFSQKAMDDLLECLPPPKGMKPWLEQQLNDAATQFAHWVLRGPNRLPRTEARNQLIKVSKAAEKLAAAMEGLHEDPRMLLRFSIWEAYPDTDDDYRHVALTNAYLELIQTLQARANVAANRPPLKQSGPEPDFDIRFTVRILMTIYIWATDQDPTYSRDPDAVDVGEDLTSSVGKLIQLFFKLLPKAKLARLPGRGPMPKGPPRTVADVMKKAGFNPALLKSAPAELLRREIAEFNKKGLKRTVNSGRFECLNTPLKNRSR